MRGKRHRDNAAQLKSAICAIHDHLHAGRIDDAHRACECAMSGKPVRQRNLTVPQSARIQEFAAEFNSMCERMGVNAAFVAFLESATVRGATSIQLGGSVPVCKYVEGHLSNRGSIYQGEHQKGETNEVSGMRPQETATAEGR